jgi:hypothetical protein
MWTYRFAGLRLHAEIPLVAFLGLVHFWIPLALLVFRGGWSGDQGGINDRALLHGHASRLEMGFDGLKDSLAKIVLSNRWRKAKIVVSSGIRSLKMSIPAKRRMTGTSIRASSMAGSLNHLVHFREKFLPFGLLFRRALLVISKTQLLAAHQSSAGLRSEAYSRVN